MLSNILLSKSEPSSITVQTRRGRTLENYIAPPTTSIHDKRFRLLLNEHPQWEVRKSCVGGYNCAGLVWASRRTCLTSPADWLAILSAPDGDGYREVAEHEAVVGDVVCYIASNGEIAHVARICRIDNLYSGSGQKVGRGCDYGNQQVGSALRRNRPRGERH